MLSEEPASILYWFETAKRKEGSCLLAFPSDVDDPDYMTRKRLWISMAQASFMPLQIIVYNIDVSSKRLHNRIEISIY